MNTARPELGPALAATRRHPHAGVADLRAWQDARLRRLVLHAYESVPFYRRLFELDPGLRPLFKGAMTAQGARLMTALGGVVGSLDQLERILPALCALGHRHGAYGVRPEHYATVGEALIWTLEQALGPAFTREMRRAWIDAYGRLAWTMIAAAEEDALPEAA